MKNWTVLRTLSALVIAITVILTIINYSSLSSGEGWGVVGMIGTIGLGLVGLAIDEVFKMLIGDRRWVNIFEAVLLAVTFGLLTWSYLYRSI